MSSNRFAAAALAALGAASAIPIPLAQLDFAGVINVFNIDAGDAPHAPPRDGWHRRMAHVRRARTRPRRRRLDARRRPGRADVLIAAALAGLVTAMPLWLPAGFVLGAAAVLIGDPDTGRAAT